MTLNIQQLRQYAIARSLFAPTDLLDAVTRLGFVQIDPIQSPATAQDLILRHRVAGYQQGDLQRAYPDLPLEEAYFINHGYLPRDTAQTLWSNKPAGAFLTERSAQVAQIIQYAGDVGEIHAKALNQHMGSAVIKNAWGGSGQEGTHIAQRMHANGKLRIVRRQKGGRIYGLPLNPPLDLSPEHIIATALATLAQTYAPFTAQSLTYMGRLLTHGRPDLKPALKQALTQLGCHFASASIDGQTWYWPRDESPHDALETDPDRLCILAPFDPLVWDRDRFERFWGWTYKFEAYKPAAIRQFGYYAMPMLWRQECIGWANVGVNEGKMTLEMGFVRREPKDKAFKMALKQELAEFSALLSQ